MNTQPTSSPLQVRAYRHGDPSRVALLHCKLYEELYGFGGTFEYYLLQGLAHFLEHPEKSMLWVADSGDKLAGSIAICQADEDTAQLRWLIVDQEIQGSGLGNQLVNTALDFCRQQGYKRVFLWTIDMLGPARHLYQKNGFHLNETKPNTEWIGSTLIEERWDLEL